MLGRRTALVGLTVVGLLGGGASAGAAQLESVGTFSSPLSIAAPPGDPDRVFVVEQGGTIQELIDGVKQAKPFLSLGSIVAAGGEQGLLSMAFAPDYATSHHLFVYYTATAPTVDQTGDIEVDELTASTPDHVDPATRQRVLTAPHHFPDRGNHNGGQLQFGPDGMLYMGTGDGGGGNDTQGNGQNLTVSDPANDQSPLLGKMLRVEPVPGNVAAPGNPFLGPAGDVWMLGLRNPWRWSFDRQTGDMIIGDVGQGLYEEVDFVRSPGPGLAPGGGANFGWNLREGLHSFSATNETQATPTLTDPVIEENHSPDGWLAIIGGYVLRDPGLPELAGTYLFGDNAKGRLYGASLATPLATNVRDLGNALAVPGLTGMGEDACGRVYVALLGGEVERLINNTGGYTCTSELAAVPSLPGGGGGTTPVAPPPPTTADTTAPKLTPSHARQRHIAAFGQFVLHAGCSEHCTITAGGHLRIGRRLLGVRSVTHVVAAGAQVTITLKLSHTLRRLVLSALRRHRHPVVAVMLRAVDAAGNAATRRFTVAVTG